MIKPSDAIPSCLARISILLHTKIATTFIIFCASLILLVHIKTPFNYFDEGLAVFNAAKVLKGGFPYKDFWTIYPPGQVYLLAAFFRAFGSSLLVSRLLDTSVRFIITISVWLIARKISSRTLAFFAFITVTLLLASIGFFSYSMFPALALGLLSILCFLYYLDHGRRAWLVLDGMLMGLTSFFRWDVGLYVCMSIVASLFLFRLSWVIQESSFSARALFVISDIVIILGAALIIIVPCYGVVISVSGFKNLWDQIVIYPVLVSYGVRGLPFPALLSPFFLLSGLKFSNLLGTYLKLLPWLRFYFPLAVCGVAVFIYARSIHKKSITFKTQFIGRIAVVIMGVLVFPQALSRYDYPHVMLASIMAALVVVSLLSPDIFNSVKRPIKIGLLLLLTGVIAIYWIFSYYNIKTTLKSYGPLECYSQIERASCVPLSLPGEAQAVEYIKTHTPEDEAIFVGNRRHDKILASDIGFYFLSDRQNASRYSQLEPGIATTLSVQQEIVRDLESKNTHWLVLVNIPESKEPNGSSVSSGVFYLDEYIKSNYSLNAEFGAYQILKLVTR